MQDFPGGVGTMPMLLSSTHLEIKDVVSRTPTLVFTDFTCDWRRSHVDVTRYVSVSVLLLDLPVMLYSCFTWYSKLFTILDSI